MSQEKDRFIIYAYTTNGGNLDGRQNTGRYFISYNCCCNYI